MLTSCCSVLVLHRAQHMLMPRAPHTYFKLFVVDAVVVRLAWPAPLSETCARSCKPRRVSPVAGLRREGLKRSGGGRLLGEEEPRGAGSPEVWRGLGGDGAARMWAGGLVDGPVGAARGASGTSC